MGARPTDQEVAGSTCKLFKHTFLHKGKKYGP